MSCPTTRRLDPAGNPGYPLARTAAASDSARVYFFIFFSSDIRVHFNGPGLSRWAGEATGTQRHVGLGTLGASATGIQLEVKRMIGDSDSVSRRERRRAPAGPAAAAH